MKKALFYLLPILLILGVVGSDLFAQAARTLSEQKQTDRNPKARVYQLSWKATGQANQDTSITMLVGATQKFDTTDTPYPIWGANTMTLQTQWTCPNDTCVGVIRADFSNDGTNWAPFPNVGIPLGAGVDSSEFVSSTDATKITTGTSNRVKNITGFPTAQFIRFRFDKLACAATDTIKLQARLFVVFNDE